MMALGAFAMTFMKKSKKRPTEERFKDFFATRVANAWKAYQRARKGRWSSLLLTNTRRKKPVFLRKTVHVYTQA